MDHRKTRRAALMSIHPRYSSAILSGSKRVEFRKRPLASDIEVVVIYTTSPVQAVTGEFIIAGQIMDTPAALWDRLNEVGGIDPDSYFAYFAGHDQAVGILIDDVKTYARPRPLEAVDPGARPPQSFKYLPLDDAAWVA